MELRGLRVEFRELRRKIRPDSRVQSACELGEVWVDDNCSVFGVWSLDTCFEVFTMRRRLVTRQSPRAKYQLRVADVFLYTYDIRRFINNTRFTKNETSALKTKQAFKC